MCLKMRKFFFLSGAAGVLFYALHVVLGGILWKGFNHLMQPISDLTATGSPHKDLLTGLTTLYAGFCIFFAGNVVAYSKRHFDRTTFVGAILFLSMHIVSGTYGFFPQDPAGADPTMTGIMHLAVTALIIPLSIGSPLVMGLGLLRNGSTKTIGRFSVICGICIFLFGGTTAFLYANGLPFFGLAERVNIGVLQLWTLILSLYIFITFSKRNYHVL